MTINDLIKNPILYYVAIPLCASVWPLSLAVKYLPAMTQARDDWAGYVVDANDRIHEILTLDPERLTYARKKGEQVDFEYAVAIEKVARTCGIPRYDLSAGTLTSDSQTARLKIDDVGITQCAKFLSTLQLHWNALQCTQVTLDKKRDTKDTWSVSLSFIYFY